MVLKWEVEDYIPGWLEEDVYFSYLKNWFFLSVKNVAYYFDLVINLILVLIT